MTALAGEDQKYWKTCYSVLHLRHAVSNEAGAGPLKGKRDLDKAKALVKESGYKGEKIVLMPATDQSIVHAQALVTAEALRKIGLNVDLQAMDWGTLITRRTSRKPIDKGGWSIFHTWLVGPDMSTPRSISRCAPMARRRGSAGRPTRSSRRCGSNGWRRPTSRLSKSSPRRYRRRHSPAYPSSRPASSSFPPPSAGTSRASSSRRSFSVERREESERAGRAA